jgi:predicted esterase
MWSSRRKWLGAAALAAASWWGAAGAAAAAAGREAAARGHGEWGVAYAPADTSTTRPAIVFLHGMNGWSPENSCAYFERAAAPFGFLVCPRGNAADDEGPMWSGSYASVAPRVHAALDAAAALAPGKLDRSGGGTLMGFSNGAWFAVEVATHEPRRWTGLVLISMHLTLDAPRLRAAGIRRVVLAAGERDGSYASMKALAERTDAAGLPTRFMDLGPVGHELPDDMRARMCDAVAWVREADPAACGLPVGR